MKENADKHRALDTTEVQKNLRESAEQMFRLRFQMSMGQMDPLKKYRALKKDRARMLTVLRERELHLASAEHKPKPVAPKPAAKSAAPKAKAAEPKAKAAAKPKTAAKPKAQKVATASKSVTKKTSPRSK